MVSAYPSVQALPIVPIVTNSGSDIQITFPLLTVQSFVLLLVISGGLAGFMRQFSDSVYPADVHDAHLLTCKLSSAQPRPI